MQQKSQFIFAQGDRFHENVLTVKQKTCALFCLRLSHFSFVTSVPMFYIPLLGNVFQIVSKEVLEIINQSVTSQSTTVSTLFWCSVFLKF